MPSEVAAKTSDCRDLNDRAYFVCLKLEACFFKPTYFCLEFEAYLFEPTLLLFLKLGSERSSLCIVFDFRVLIELTLGHLRYHLTDVPPQPNSPPDYVFRTDQPSKKTTLDPNLAVMQVSA